MQMKSLILVAKPYTGKLSHCLIFAEFRDQYQVTKNKHCEILSYCMPMYGLYQVI